MSRSRPWVALPFLLCLSIISPAYGDFEEDCEDALEAQGSSAGTESDARYAHLGGDVAMLIEAYADHVEATENKISGIAPLLDVQELFKRKLAKLRTATESMVYDDLLSFARDERQMFTARIAALDLIATQGEAAQEDLLDYLREELDENEELLHSAGQQEAERAFENFAQDPRPKMRDKVASGGFPEIAYYVHLANAAAAVMGHSEEIVQRFSSLLEISYEPSEQPYNAWETAQTAHLIHALLRNLVILDTRSAQDVIESHIGSLREVRFQDSDHPGQDDWIPTAASVALFYVTLKLVPSNGLNELFREALSTLHEKSSYAFFRNEIDQLGDESRTQMIGLLGAIHRYELTYPEEVEEFEICKWMTSASQAISDLSPFQLEKLYIGSRALEASPYRLPPEVQDNVVQTLSDVAHEAQLTGLAGQTSIHRAFINLAARLIPLTFSDYQPLVEVLERSLSIPGMVQGPLGEQLQAVIELLKYKQSAQQPRAENG